MTNPVAGGSEGKSSSLFFVSLDNNIDVLGQTLWSIGAQCHCSNQRPVDTFQYSPQIWQLLHGGSPV